MNTCKTCRWWDAKPLDEFADTECGPAPDYPSLKIVPRPCCCPLIVDVSNGKWNDLALDAAGYSDCEGYYATFRTGQDFGCIHHQTQPAPLPPEKTA